MTSVLNSAMSLAPGPIAGAALAGFFLTERLRNGPSARSLRTGAADRGSTWTIVAAYLVVGIALTLHIGGPRIPESARWGGVLLAGLGLLLRVAAFHILGPSYSRTLRVDQGQELVTRGVYRWVRHPGYASAILIWGGAAAASGSALVLAAVGVVLVSVYVYRIRAEEQMLATSFGEAYRQYQAQSWRLVPFLY